MKQVLYLFKKCNVIFYSLKLFVKSATIASKGGFPLAPALNETEPKMVLAFLPIMVPAPNNTNESFAETPSSKVPPIAGHWVYYRPSYYASRYRPYG